MDHKAFLSSLDSAQREQLTKRSNAKGLIHLAGHWGAIVICGAVILADVRFWQAMMVVHGIVLIFLFTLLHETSHKTPFNSGWINHVVGHVCGFVLFMPANWFGYFHYAHHRFTQIPGQDPELDAPKPASWKQFILHVSGIPIWISLAKTLGRNVFGAQQEAFVPVLRRTKVRLEAQIYMFAYAALLAVSVWFGTTILIYIWLVPMVLGQPFLRLYLLAEHSRCPRVANIFENTRTTFTNALVRAVAWNMPYHVEHHSYPSVPFYKLPELHALIEPHLQVTSQGYAAFSQMYVQEEIT